MLDQHEREVQRLLRKLDAQENDDPMSLIRKKRRVPDDFFPYQDGKRGMCILCRKFQNLTVDHVPPQNTGNSCWMEATSYMANLQFDPSYIIPRRFKNGIKFRSICSDCNNRLGAVEDKEIGRVFAYLNNVIQLGLPRSNLSMKVRPNLLYRGLMAHLAAANDHGNSDLFDDDTHRILSKEIRCNQTDWNLYYWPYSSEEIFILRGAALASFIGEVSVAIVYVLKMAPLAFLFCKEDFFDLPNLRTYLRNDDEASETIPFSLSHPDLETRWPAVPSDHSGRAVLTTANSFGLIARPVHFIKKPQKFSTR